MHDDPERLARVRALGDALRARGWMMASAESCTGGLIAATCTEVAGSSDWFERGVVSYSNDAKTALLDVPPTLIAAHGAVSDAVVRAMAQGLLAHARADVAVAVTGVAGPGGGTPAKPVGTVWLAIATRDGACEPERLQLDGDRRAVRQATVDRALQRLLASAVAGTAR